MTTKTKNIYYITAEYKISGECTLYFNFNEGKFDDEQKNYTDENNHIENKEEALRIFDSIQDENLTNYRLEEDTLTFDEEGDVIDSKTTVLKNKK